MLIKVSEKRGVLEKFTKEKEEEKGCSKEKKMIRCLECNFILILINYLNLNALILQFSIAVQRL